MISKVKPQQRRKSDSALQAQKKKQAFSTPQPPKTGKGNKQNQSVVQKGQTLKQNVKKGTPKQPQKMPSANKNFGKKRKLEDDDDDDDDDEDEDSEIQFKATPKTGLFKGQLEESDGDEEEDDDDDEEDDDDEDEEDDDDEDEEDDSDADDDDEEEEDDSEKMEDDADEEEEKADVSQPAKNKKVAPALPSKSEKQKKNVTAQAVGNTVDEKRKMDLDSKTLYIKNLPIKCTVREIKALVPEVKQVRLRINTNRFSKKKVFSGYAYLEFASEAAAEKNYKKLTGAVIQGNTIVVDYVGHKSSFIQARRKKDVGPENLDPLKLYVAGLPTDCTEADLRKVFPKATDIKIPVRQKDKKAFGYGFVSFSSGALAKEYHDKCQSVTLRDMNLVVLFAHKKKEQPQKQETVAKKANESKKQKDSQPPAKKAKVEVEEEDDEDDEEEEDEDDKNASVAQQDDDEEDDDDEDDEDDDEDEDDDDDDDDDDEDDDDDDDDEDDD